LWTAAAVVACAFVTWPALVTVIGLYMLGVAAGVTWPKLQFFMPVICRGPTGRNALALTFDDGPDPSVTPALLALLRRANVKATFFCVGERVQRHADVARQIVTDGHLLGNHGFSHSYRTNLFSTARLRDELRQCQETLAKVAGAPPRFFRPPMGLTNPRVARVARELGLTAVGWSAGGKDQRARSADEILARVRRGLRPGAIILLHDAGVDSAVWLAAIEQLLAELPQKGFETCRLDELLSR